MMDFIVSRLKTQKLSYLLRRLPNKNNHQQKHGPNNTEKQKSRPYPKVGGGGGEVRR